MKCGDFKAIPAPKFGVKAKAKNVSAINQNDGTNNPMVRCGPHRVS